MISGTALLRVVSLGMMVLTLAACAPSGYMVSSPSPSGLKFEAAPPPRANLSLVDRRTDHNFSTGRLPAQLNADNAPIDPPGFLAVHLQSELASRGVPVQVVRGDKGVPRLNLTTFKVINHRATGFSPFVTLTYLGAEFETSSGKRRVGAFIRRGKVPVWSFQEVVEPTFSQPLSLAVKELATKIADQLHGLRGSDKTVDDLAAKVSGSRSSESFLDVHALGFTNNPRAVSTLVALVRDSDEYVRLAAISSLGTLRAISQYNLLKSIYEDRSTPWHDRAMALKAIGDLDTAEGRAFLAQEMQYWQGQGRGNEPQWTLQVIRLYL